MAGAICTYFVDMGAPVKTQAENGLSQLTDLRFQTIDVSDQYIFVLKDSGVYDEEEKKNNVSDKYTVVLQLIGASCSS